MKLAAEMRWAAALEGTWALGTGGLSGRRRDAKTTGPWVIGSRKRLTREFGAAVGRSSGAKGGLGGNLPTSEGAGRWGQRAGCGLGSRRPDRRLPVPAG